MSEFLIDLWREQKALVTFGIGFLILLGVLTALSMFDSTEILGINRWIKPMKFAASIAIFLLTLAVYLSVLPGFERSKIVIGWGVILMLVGEIVIITAQAARGTTSHFNVKNPFDAMLFAAMGLMIVVSTILCAYLLFLYFRADFANTPPAIVWSLRLGLILFLLASVEGGFMSQQLAHTIGAPDGGAGLPFVNWSTKHGDLRVAHFVGMHALQAVPLAALVFVRLQNNGLKMSATILTFVFAFVYLSAFTFVFIQALHGKPLLRIERTTASQIGGLQR